MPEPDGIPNCPRCRSPLRSGRLLGLCPKCVGRVAFGIASTGTPAGPVVDRPPLLRLGPYELREELGRGAMGAVYRARDPGLGREVAVKVILSGQFASETERRRFLSEAGHAAGLDHPNIVPIHQSGETDGRAWFAMKLVEGRTLAELVLEGTFPPAGPGRFDRIAALVSQAARAVGHAHQRGVLHRDLKPANLLVDRQGEVHVSDFGLARRVDAATSLTAAGSPVGTPAYMAPEAAKGGEPVTIAADVWSLGAILYELLTGRGPFPGAGLAEVLRAVAESDPVEPDRKSVPRDLSTIALKCLGKDPRLRYASMDLLADDLDRWRRGEPVLARPVGTFRRLALWTRRKPAQAALTGLGILTVLLLSVGGPLVAMGFARIGRRERAANVEARDRLFESLVAQARGQRLSMEPGRRGSGLRAIREAAALRVTPELRDEAMALLATKDLGVPRKGSPPVSIQDVPAFDGGLERITVMATNFAAWVLDTRTGRRVIEIPETDTNWFPRFRSLSPDGRFLTVVDGEREMLVVEVESGRVLRRHLGAKGGDFSADGSLYAAQEAGGGIRIRRLVDGEEVALLPPNGAEGGRFKFDPEPGSSWVALSHGTRIRLRDWTGLRAERIFDLPDSVQDFDWAGGRLVAALNSGSIWIHDFERDRSEVLAVHREPVARIRLGPDGRELMTWSYDGTSVGIDLGSGFPWMRGSRYLPIRFSRDGGRVALQSGSDWFVASIERPAFRSEFPVRGSHSIGFSRDGRWILAGGESGMVVVDATTGRTLLTLPLDTCTHVAALPGGQNLVVTSRDSVTRWTLTAEAGRLALREPQVLLRSAGEILETSALTADGEKVLVPTFRQKLHVLRADGGGAVTNLGGLMIPRSPSLTPDGRWLALGTFHGRGLEIRDLTGSEPPRLLTRGNGNAGFSPDGRLLAWAGRDASRIFETGTWREVFTLPTGRPGDLPGHLAWAPGGRLLAVTRQGNEIVLVDSGRLERLGTLRIGEPSRVSVMSFSPDGLSLALIAGSGQGELWRLRGLRGELGTLGIPWSLPEPDDLSEAVPSGLDVAPSH